jgi:hypothetical protein
MLGAAAPVPGQNRSVFIELRVDDIDATWERVKGLVPQTVPEIVLEPTDMPWGNRSVILRDPDSGLVNLFAPSPRRPRRSTASDPSLRRVPATTRATHLRRDLELPRQARNTPPRTRAGLTN